MNWCGAVVLSLALATVPLAAVPEEEEQGSPAIVELKRSDLLGQQMLPIPDWAPYLTTIGPGDGRFAEVSRFKSADGRAQASVKRFERVTLRLSNWPIDEFMYFLAGEVEISDANGNTRFYRPGDAIVIPKRFSGIWRQLQTIEMITLTYGPDL